MKLICRIENLKIVPENSFETLYIKAMLGYKVGMVGEVHVERLDSGVVCLVIKKQPKRKAKSAGGGDG